MSDFREMLKRLGRAWGWVAGQFGGVLLLVLLGLAWTRLPDKHGWQVALTLIVPLLLVLSMLELQAATMRALAAEDGRRVKMLWGALTLLVWAALFWAAWAVLDVCDARIPEWAGYLNSRFSSHARARVFTYAHLVQWMTYAEWILRWVVLPGKLTVCAVASAQWGWRLPWRRLICLLWNWRWWLGVVVAALAGVLFPSHFFAGLPNGTVSHQVWSVMFKLAAAYVLGVGCWVLLLAWAAVLLDRQTQPAENALYCQLWNRLRVSRLWIGAQFGWMMAWIWTAIAVLHLLGGQPGAGGILNGLGAANRIVIVIVAMVVQTGMLRSLMSNRAKRARPVWGAVTLLLWGMLCLIAAEMQDYLHVPILQWLAAWVVAPAIFFPFAAASTVSGFRLPWRRILRVVCTWRWWLAILLAGAFGKLAELYFDSLHPVYVWDVNLATGLKMGAVDMLEMAVWILLLGWLAVLFDLAEAPARELPVENPAVDVLPESNSGYPLASPLSETGNGGAGDA